MISTLKGKTGVCFYRPQAGVVTGINHSLTLGLAHPLPLTHVEDQRKLAKLSVVKFILMTCTWGRERVFSCPVALA